MTLVGEPTRGGLRSVLRAEWTKFRTVRGWMVGAGCAGLLVILFTFLQANGKHTGYCTTPNPSSCVNGHPFVPTGPGGEAVADTYQLAARRLTGNGTITARITSLTGRIWAGPANEAPSSADTRPGLAAWAKAGLLVTPSTRQGSAYAAVMATAGHGVRFQYDYTHDQPGRPGPITGTSPVWLRLSRIGNTVTGYDSTDGATWHTVGRTSLPNLPRTIDAGLFATSPVTYQGAATQATAHFDHVAVGPKADGTGSVAPGWLEQSIGTGPRDSYTTLGRGGSTRAGDTVVISGSGDIAPAVQLVGGDTASDSLLFGSAVAILVLIVIATMFITGEYRRSLIRTTFAATPNRGVVLVAKALVVALAGFTVGAVAAAVAVPLAEHVMTANGDYVFPAGPLAVARIVAGTGALVALTATAALAIGTLVRKSATAILIGVVVFVLPTFTGPGIIGPTSSGVAAVWLYRFTPAAGFAVLGLLPRSSLVSYPYTMANGYYPVSPVVGLLVLFAYAGGALGVARFALLRRDA